MQSLNSHLMRILDRVTHVVADEVLNCASLVATYPDIGELHPALGREGHAQSLLFSGLRASGYFTFAEANYATPGSNSRQIDLAVWLPDNQVWIYLEIKPCGPYWGIQAVLADAEKLVADQPTDPRDRLRGVLAFGFRDPVGRDSFPHKYEDLSTRLQALGFREVGTRTRSLEGTTHSYVQAGLWVIGEGAVTCQSIAGAAVT
jgi:hypothetical protein